MAQSTAKKRKRSPRSHLRSASFPIQDEGLSTLLETIKREHMMREGTIRVHQLRQQIVSKNRYLNSRLDQINGIASEMRDSADSNRLETQE